MSKRTKVPLNPVLLTLVGCSANQDNASAVNGSCVVGLLEKSKVSSVPPGINSKYKDDVAGWYKESNGDYFYCINRIDASRCGNGLKCIGWLIKLAVNLKGKKYSVCSEVGC